MSSIEKISIALPQEMIAEIRDAVDSGHYSSSSEVIREALRVWIRERNLNKAALDQMRHVWEQALADSGDGVSTLDVFSRLEGKYHSMTGGR
jgi:antitoxin ParD1/3/4